MASELRIRYDEIEDIRLVGGYPDDRLDIYEVTERYPDADVIINGGLWDMSNGWICNDTIMKDIEPNGTINEGNYSDKGFGFGYNGEVYWSNRKNALVDENIRDFMGGCPVLIQNGVIDQDRKGLSNWFCNIANKIRIGMGATDEDLVFYFPEYTTDLREISQELLNKGSNWAIALDGGGSTTVVVKNNTTGEWIKLNEVTEYRKIPQWIIITKKKKPVNTGSFVRFKVRHLGQVLQGKQYDKEVEMKDYIVEQLSKKLEDNELLYDEVFKDDSYTIDLVVKINNSLTNPNAVGALLKPIVKTADDTEVLRPICESIMDYDKEWSEVRRAYSIEVGTLADEDTRATLNAYVGFYNQVANTELDKYVDILFKGIVKGMGLEGEIDISEPEPEPEEEVIEEPVVDEEERKEQERLEAIANWNGKGFNPAYDNEESFIAGMLEENGLSKEEFKNRWLDAGLKMEFEDLMFKALINRYRLDEVRELLDRNIDWDSLPR